jgi:transposase-like protein
MGILDLISSELVCSKLLRIIKWKNGIYYPICGSRTVKSHGNYKQGLKRYKCKVCRRTFSDKTGTYSTVPD